MVGDDARPMQQLPFQVVECVVEVRGDLQAIQPVAGGGVAADQRVQDRGGGDRSGWPRRCRPTGRTATSPSVACWWSRR